MKKKEIITGHLDTCFNLFSYFNYAINFFTHSCILNDFAAYLCSLFIRFIILSEFFIIKEFLN